MLKILEQLFPGDLYHSYVVEGDPSLLANELLWFLESRGEIEKQSQDVICQMYESFTMEDSRVIKDWHNKLGITSGKRICILAAKFINKEAEQALLKIIEEPAIDTHFFMVVPDSSVLLPTIISRVQIVKIPAHSTLGVISGNEEKIKSVEITKEASSFIKMTPADRINKIVQIIKEKKEDENSNLRFYVLNFINELEKDFYQKFKGNKNDKNIIFILGELEMSRKYISVPGASVKMILEHLALVI